MKSASSAPSVVLTVEEIDLDTGLPKKHKTSRRPEQSVKIGEILNFTSAIIAVLATGIFYFAGWVYLSHWYGFYGVSIVDLHLSNQLILIHGIPGILIIILTGFIAASVFAILKFASKGSPVTTSDMPMLVLTAYLLSVFVLLVFVYLSYEELHFWVWPLEVGISIISVIVIYFVLSIFEQIVDIVSGEGIIILRSGVIALGFFPGFKPARIVAWMKLFYEAAQNRDYSRILAALLGIDSSIKAELANREQEFLEQVARQQFSIKNAAVKTWQFWVGAFVILYFLISISVSSILGEWDARTGRRIMVGGWNLQETMLYSKDNNLPLPVDTQKSTVQRKVYGPLTVIASDGDKYYLTDWIYQLPYQGKPNLYIIMVNDQTTLGLQVLAPTPTLTPTRAPSRTPRPTLTPTSTVQPPP